MLISNDDPQVLALLDAALCMRWTPEGGLLPAYDHHALLPLADYLDDRGDERAVDVRQLARAAFFLPGGGPSPYPRPIACGAWWNISSLCPVADRSAVCWQVYPGTPQHDWTQVAWRSARSPLDEAGVRNDLSRCGLPCHVPGPPRGVLSVGRPATAPLRFEEAWLVLAAGLMGKTREWLWVRHELLLQPDEQLAARCLACCPPPDLLAQLRDGQPDRFRRLAEMARAESEQVGVLVDDDSLDDDDSGFLA